MRQVFADTSFYVAIFSTKDIARESAVQFSREYTGRVVTTEYVLIELVNWYSRSQRKESLARFVAGLLYDPLTTVVPAGRDLFVGGPNLFAERRDKAWSLTDCTSFVVMGDLNLTDALTSDRHFEQAGFKPLLTVSTEG